MVLRARLELARLSARASKTRVATITPPQHFLLVKIAVLNLSDYEKIV